MAQNRDAPAYQEYAASMMARTEFRTMGLAARGLLYTLRLECWVNVELPADPSVLARILGLPPESVRDSLSDLGAFFTFDEGKVRSPELDHYRTHLAERRQRQSAGGRSGAAKTNAARGRTGVAAPPATPPGDPRVGPGSLVQVSPDQLRQANQDGSDDWVNDYERASRGG